MVREIDDTQRETSSSRLIAEICYYISFAALKRLWEKGEISETLFKRINVGVAEKYGVLKYSI